jgi:hypothetical protein
MHHAGLTVTWTDLKPFTATAPVMRSVNVSASDRSISMATFTCPSGPPSTLHAWRCNERVRYRLQFPYSCTSQRSQIETARTCTPQPAGVLG